MRKRLLLSASILAGLVCVVLLVLAILPPRPPRPGVTKANFDRIEIGMGIAEIEDIFKDNPALSSPNGILYAVMPKWKDGRKPRTWNGEEGRALIYEVGGIVVGKVWEAFGVDFSFLGRIRRWLGL